MRHLGASGLRVLGGRALRELDLEPSDEQWKEVDFVYIRIELCAAACIATQERADAVGDLAGG